MTLTLPSEIQLSLIAAADIPGYGVRLP
jgi:hypothetical protein